MKKSTLYLLPFTLLLFSFLLSPFSLSAQDKPDFTDGSFEKSWKTETGSSGSYEDYITDPDFFRTLNSLYAVFPDPGDITAVKEFVNPQHGSCCIKLVSGGIKVGSSTIFLPGLVGTIDEDFIGQFTNSGGEISITKDWGFNVTPRALEGFYRYLPVDGDSALIDIGFHDGAGEVFVEKLIIKEPTGAWTPFSIKIPQKYWNDEFLSIRVLFVASAGVNFKELMECKGQKGSALWIDNISLKYDLGIEQNLFSTLKANLYPNPATDVLKVELNEPFVGNIVVYDLSGRMVMEDHVDGTECQLNVAALAAGNYAYRLMKGNTIFAQGKFVVTK